jgi:hypothetical protein
MTFATVRAAAEHLARAGTITPHQLAALQALDESLSDEQRQEFTELWRAQGSPAAPRPEAQNELANLQSWLTFLTGPEVSRLSQNKISPLTVAEACGFIGCVIVETGHPLLDKLDVIEAGSGAGRGAMQYTGVRRTAYDKARAAAIAKGINPGGNAWQQLYFAEEYAGLHDPPQGSLIGWTRVFEDRPAGMDPARAAAYFSEVYFRPGVPHLDRRQAEARRVWGLVESGRLTVAGRPPVQLQQQTGYGNPLQVPWFAQMDSADRAQAARMCFSSSCAMLLQYLKPGTLRGANGDDQYLKRVQSYGDTTDPTAQIRALSSYGIKARFTKVAGFATLEQQINAGVPVPVGFLHRGPVSAPTGGGHWLIVVGYTKDHLIVHDPFGEADLVSGATLGGVARFARYSRRNFGPRWMVEGSNTGWAIIAER